MKAKRDLPSGQEVLAAVQYTEVNTPIASANHEAYGTIEWVNRQKTLCELMGRYAAGLATDVD